MFILPDCPYCHEAKRLIGQLYRENPEYSKVSLRVIDERAQKELADRYDYYYVPTFYVGGQKLHEGVPDMEKVRQVFEAACRPVP